MIAQSSSRDGSEGRLLITPPQTWTTSNMHANGIITSISDDSDIVIRANIWGCREVELLAPSICITKHVVVELSWCKAACTCACVDIYVHV